MKRTVVSVSRIGVSLVAVVCLSTLAAFAEGPDSAGGAKAVEPVKPSATQTETTPPDSGHAGLGVHVGLNGIGFETAVRLTHKTNLRGGLDFFPGFKPHFTTDSNIAFDGKIGLRTMKVQYDYFPRAGGFHISPGVMVLGSNLLTATAHSTAGDFFDLGNNTYMSDPSNPTQGGMKVSFSHRVAPMFTVGFGNLVSRKEGKHFSVPFEAGVAFTGAPKSVWNYSGNVCTTTGFDPVTGAPITSCGPASGNQQFKADVLTEQNKFNQSASSFKVYPIVSIGLGYKF